MKWFTDLEFESQAVIILVIGFSIFAICSTILTSIDGEQKLEVEKAAIEAGLHQEIVDGKAIWVK